MAADATSASLPDEVFASVEEGTEFLRSIKSKQGEEERRKLRENYRKLQDEVADQMQEVINPKDGENLLFEKLQTVDKLFKQVKHTREGALDAASLVNISELGNKRAQAIKPDFLRFRASEFCEKVRIKLSNAVSRNDNYGFTQENWVKLGAAVRPSFKCTPVLNFMYGSFERGEVVGLFKKKRAVREKDAESESTRATNPTQLSSFEDTDRGELTTAQVEHLLKTLWEIYEKNGKEPICFFEFVTNPNSYGQTVENIFYASFLVRDGHAKLFLDDENLPVIEPEDKEDKTLSETGRDSQRDSRKQQVVVTLTPKEWRDIVKTFQIEVPIIMPMKQQQTVLKDSNVLNNTSDKLPSHEGKGKGKGKKSDR